MASFDDNFKLWQDKKGRFWIWSKAENCSLAIEAKSEIEAYKEALNSLAFILTLKKERTTIAEKGLNDLKEAFDKVFPPDTCDCY